MAKQTLATSNQYLTFTLDGEAFALDISDVREVLELCPITRVPRMPEHMRGVINLRGHAVPVVDLRLKFGLPQAEDTVNTCIIIVEIRDDDGLHVMGALADAVREVVDMPAESIEPAPRMGTPIGSEFIRGMGHQGDEFVILLDIARVFTAGEVASTVDMAAGPFPADTDQPSQADS